MGRSARLWIVLGLNLGLVAGLAAVGSAARSMGVLSAALDYLADGAAVAVSLFAGAVARRRMARGAPSAAPLVAALVNGGWLLALCIIVVTGSAIRLRNGVPDVEGLPVLVMSAIAAAVMVAAALVLRADADDDDDGGDDLSMRAVLLDTIGDAAAAAGVAATGAVILADGQLRWLDPVVAIVIATVLGHHAVRLLGDVMRRLSARRAEA